MTVYPLSLRDEVQRMTIKVKVVHAKRTRLRLVAFAWLLRVACLACPCNVVVENGER